MLPFVKETIFRQNLSLDAEKNLERQSMLEFIESQIREELEERWPTGNAYSLNVSQQKVLNVYCRVLRVINVLKKEPFILEFVEQHKELVNLSRLPA